MTLWRNIYILLNPNILIELSESEWQSKRVFDPRFIFESSVFSIQVMISEKINRQQTLQATIEIAVVRIVLETYNSFRKLHFLSYQHLLTLLVLNFLGKCQTLTWHVSTLIIRRHHVPRWTTTCTTHEWGSRIGVILFVCWSMSGGSLHVF